jgi:predicted Zn-dependent protease
MKLLSLIILILSSLVMSGCLSTTTKNSVAGVDRSQLLILPSSSVDEMSAQAYNETLDKAKQDSTLNTDQAMLNRVTTISNKLIAQVGVFREDAKAWNWQVNVEKSDDLNAYCMPGGKIMVYSGLVEKINATDDELAAVIGHEIAHALREHGRERMSQAYIQQYGLSAVATLAGEGLTGTIATKGAEMGTNLFFSLPNSREQERESDRIGLELAARAGYNPNAAVSLWQKMQAENPASPPEFLSTHPTSTNRIAALKALAPKMMPLYEAAK